MVDMFYDALSAFPDTYPSEAEIERFWYDQGYLREDVQQALLFLGALKRIADIDCPSTPAQSMRVYSRSERATLGVAGIHYIQRLEQLGALSVAMRERLINCAELTGQRAMSLERLSLLLRLIMWQCNEPISPLFRQEILGESERPTLSN